MIWGGVVCGVGLAVLSLAAPLPQPPEAETRAPADGGTRPGPAETGSGIRGDGRDADLVEVPPTAPAGTESAPDTLASLDRADTEPAAVPQVGGQRDALGDPAAVPEAPAVDVDPGEAPVVPAPQAAAPSEPGQEVDLTVSTEPAALPQLDAGGTSVQAPPAPAADSPEAGVAAREGEAPRASSARTTAPAQPDTEVGLSISIEPAQPDAPDVTEETAFGTPPTAGEAPEIESQPDSAPAEPDSDALGAPEQGSAPATVDAPPPPEEDAPRMAGLPQIGGASDTDDRSAPALEDTAPRVAPDAPSRLPTIGEDNGAAPDTPAPVDPDTAGLPPIKAHAQPFEAPEGVPLMSIVLIDGPDSIGAEALADFPYPLTFAVDPTEPGAAEKMRAHRAAGFEVVALIDLPAAAQPADAEVAMAAALGTLDETVAILEGTGTGIQGNRPLSDQVTEIVSQTGHGLITQDNGLNTVPKLAEREGVPTAIVFRDFDGAGQSPVVMRRFLDQAAFRAGQQGSVVMLGRVQPDTVSALLLWGLQDRASRVSLAPISTLLTKVR